MSEPKVVIERVGSLVELRITGSPSLVMSTQSAVNLGARLIDAGREPEPSGWFRRLLQEFWR